MVSVEELRAEARRLMEAIKNVADPQIKQQLASRAVELTQRAELLERSEDPEILRANIRRYQAMLRGGISDPDQRRIVEEMLADAEAILATLRKKAP
jgi:hypothetical protein